MNDRCVLANVLADQAAKYGSRQALSYVNEKGECLAQYSYDDFNRKTSLCAQGLEALGLQPCTNVLIFTTNRPEMLITEFACYANRAVSVSIYSTSSVDQVNYILNDCKPSAIFVGDAKQLDIMRKAMADDFKDVPLIGYDCEGEGVMPWKSLIALGEAASPQCIDAVERRRMAVCPDDTATLIYTSGTTGEPKAAVLTHKNFNTVVRIHRERLTQLSDKDTSLCFLPLSHIFEKGWTYFCIYSGISVAINQNPREIGKTITKVKPSCMCSVPRFWEKAYATINEKLAEMPAWKRWLSRRALACGRKRNLDFVRLGKKVPWLTEAMYKFYDNQFFAPVRRLMGIANGTIYPTAGAPISSTIVEFFRAMGVPMVIGYGLSETTATVTCFPDVGYVIGSVGTVMPELQVRIGPEGEIEVKGDTVMKEYYNKPQATAEAFTKDGWLRTGDAGYFDEEGALVLTERLKDLFKTSNGKYIAPQAIESKLGGDKFIDQVAVVGESRKYVTAIIIPAYEALKEYARKKHIAFKNMEDLIRNSDIVKMIQARIEKLQEGLPSFEQIKKFTLLPHAFTIESGELTNTLKIRRPVIAAHYAKEIDAMY